MFLFSSSGFLIIALNLYSILDSSWCQSGQDVSQWMCADENCSEPIADAVVTKPYTPDHPLKVFVRKGDKLKILRQIPKGSDQKLVYVQSMVSKKRGLLSVNYIQERKILVPEEKLIRTNLGLPSDELPTLDNKPSDINPSAAATIIDGTTFFQEIDYPSPYASYAPTQTPGSPSESVVQSTTPPSIPASDPERRDSKGSEVQSDVSDTFGETPMSDISLGEKSDLASVPAGNEHASDVEDLGISSTPASTIPYAKPSSVPEIPKEANIIIMSTTEVPYPAQESDIDHSQEASDSPSQPNPDKPTPEESPEGSGSSPNEGEASGVWGGIKSMFSLSSGSGEVEDDHAGVSADFSLSRAVEDDHTATPAGSTSPDVSSLRRGPNPTVEGESSSEKLAEESSEAVEPFDTVDEESADGKSKRSVSDSSELPGNDDATEPAERNKEVFESAKPEPGSTDSDNPDQGPVDVGDPEQRSADPIPPAQDSVQSADFTPGSNDSLTDAGSGTNLEPNPVKLDYEKTVDPVDSTKAVEQDSGKVLDKSSGASLKTEDAGLEDELKKDGNVTESESEIPQQHTQETRVSMSSSHKSDDDRKKRVKLGGASQQELQAESSEVTVEIDDSSPEDTSGAAVYDQVPAYPDLVHPDELHTSSDGKITQSVESESTNVGASDHLVESERKVLKTEGVDVGAGGTQVGVEDIVKDDLQSVTSTSTPEMPRVEAEVQQPSTPEPPAPVGGPADAEKSFGLSDLDFASPMQFVDPRKTNPDLYAANLPSTEKHVADENQWTASVEEVPLYNQWASIPEPSVPPADPVPTAQSPSADQPAESDTTPKPNLASEVGPAPFDPQPVTPTSFQEPDPSVESSEPWYSGVFSLFGSLQDMLSGSSPEPEQPVHQADSLVTPKTIQADEQSQKCHSNSCGTEEKTFDVVSSILEYYAALPTKTLILMVVTAGAVLIFSLGYYFLENQQRDVELVSKYNELLGKLFIEQREKETLVEQLASANESMTQISFDTTKFDDEIRELKALVQKYKEEKAAIEEKEKEANRRRIISDKNYNDLLKTLSVHKQKGERSTLSAEVKNLKDRIEADEINIASLKEQLLEKKDEIKSLNGKLLDLGETNRQLERNVEEAISQVHDNAEKYQESISKLEKTIEENMASLVKLEAECTQLKKEKESLAIEKELAESSLQKYQQLTPSNALTDWLAAKEVRVSLLAAEKKVKALSEENEALARNNKQLKEKWNSLKLDLDLLNENYEKAEREKIDALTRLQVLSDYFKEKETQLQEELGSKEALWLQKQSDDRSIYEQMRALREENTSFKNQNETLKREILEQEASYKKLIASANEKADEHWVALRHTERRLKEAQMEASQLRSRLSTLGTTNDNPADKIKGEVNGDMPPYGSATSPQFMLYPHEFLPPPPLPTTTPSRPPPLGRISSPPPVDFVPPPPIIPFESLFLPPSPPPPVPHAMMNITHKPQPLDGAHHRTQKDSQSSNHSSESTADKPRRNKR